MVWCRAELQSDSLSVYTDFFYEPQTYENPLKPACTIPCVVRWPFYIIPLFVNHEM